MGGVGLREGQMRGKVFVDERAHHVVDFVRFGVESVVDVEEEDWTGV